MSIEGLGVGLADIISSLLGVGEMVVQLSYDIQSPEGYHHLDLIQLLYSVHTHMSNDAVSG